MSSSSNDVVSGDESNDLYDVDEDRWFSNLALFQQTVKVSRDEASTSGVRGLDLIPLDTGPLGRALTKQFSKGDKASTFMSRGFGPTYKGYRPNGPSPRCS